MSHSIIGDDAHIILGSVGPFSGPVTLVHEHGSDPQPRADNEFLFSLSPISPSIDKAGIDGTYAKFASAEAFLELLEPHKTVHQWIIGGDSRCLWIRDKSDYGHTLLVSMITDRLSSARMDGLRGAENIWETPPLVHSYFICQAHRDESVSVSQVLAGLLRLLLQQRPSLLSHIREVYALEIQSAKGSPSEFHVLSKIFRQTLTHADLASQIVVLAIQGVDRVVDSQDVKVSDLFHLIRQTTTQFPANVKWLFSSNPSSGLQRALDSVKLQPTTLQLSADEVVAAIDLKGVIRMVKGSAETMLDIYNLRREYSKLTVDDLSWFAYSKTGRAWLEERQHGLMGGRVVWCQSDSINNSLHLADLAMMYSKSGALALAHFSFRASVSAHSRHVIEPHAAIAVWSLFAQLAQVACTSSGCTWEEMLLSLPASLLGDLRSVYSSRTGQLNLAEPSTGPRVGVNRQNSAEAITDEHLRQYSFLESCHIDLLLGLLRGIIAKLSSASHETLLILDCFESALPESWKSLSSLLQLESEPSPKLVFCGDSREIEMSKVGAGWKELLGAQVSEDTEYQECLLSLYFSQIHTRREQVADALADTSQWLWSNKTYDTWVSQGGLLWISGKAGSGKSVLAKVIQQRFYRDSARPAHIQPWFQAVCDWFYSRRGHEIGMSFVSMLRALIYQILHQQKIIYPAVRPYYRTEFDENPQDIDWKLPNLECALRGISDSPATLTTVAIIDALDESEDKKGSPKSLLRTLELFSGLAKTCSSRIRLVVLSRPEPQIEKRLRHFHQISMQDHNKGDINTIIEAGMESLRSAWRHAIDYDSEQDEEEDDDEAEDEEVEDNGYDDKGDNDNTVCSVPDSNFMSWRHPLRIWSGLSDKLSLSTHPRMAQTSGSVANTTLPLSYDNELILKDIKDHLNKNADGVIYG